MYVNDVVYSSRSTAPPSHRGQIIIRMEFRETEL